MPRPVVLCILDGWGSSDDTESNAIAKGETPVFDKLAETDPPTTIHASGEEVGLPAGQMGNSEVGHLNIGAGRIVYQELLRIGNAITDGSFYENEFLTSAMGRAKDNDKAAHIIGLLSDGGVHSHIDHITALVEIAKRSGVKKVCVHVFMDGRDTPPDSGAGYISQIEKSIEKIGVGEIASVIGRFYAMDRDKRWDRVEKAHKALTSGVGLKFSSAKEAMEDSYRREVTDEFVEPSLIVDDKNNPVGLLQDGDEVIMANFRADRMREIVKALSGDEFSEFNRVAAPKVTITCMTEYAPNFTHPVAYRSDAPKNGLGEVLAAHGIKQLRTAETEKYAHVTFFMNGGVETPVEGEERILVPSPKVRTYDLQPEMSCQKVTDGVVGAIESRSFPVIVVNLANGDMVGHTGVWEAALKAVKTVDESVGRIIKACKKADAHLLITADHGNIEKMVENGKPMTAHTTNMVPFYYIGDDSATLRDGGRLSDIAPTILSLLGVRQPKEMTGASLFKTGKKS